MTVATLARLIQANSPEREVVVRVGDQLLPISAVQHWTAERSHTVVLHVEEPGGESLEAAL